jgi:aspartate racemase
MGPHSTAPFVDLVIRECRLQYGARHDLDFPPILIYSLPTPFFPDRPLDHEAMQRTILGGLLKLQEGGVRFVAMPCNTAHLYYDALVRAIDVPLLHIVEETLVALDDSTRSVALLATLPTAESGLYQRPLREAGLEVVEEPAWQERVTELIGAVKAGEPERDLRRPWRDLLAEIRGAGVDTLVIGCTDLRTLVEGGTAGLTAVDSSLCLARAVVRRYLDEA